MPVVFDNNELFINNDIGVELFTAPLGPLLHHRELGHNYYSRAGNVLFSRSSHAHQVSLHLGQKLVILFDY